MIRFPVLLLITLARSSASEGPVMHETSLPQVYLIDYAANHIDNPNYLQTVAAAPPDILHVGHDVVFKSHLGPCRGTGAFPKVYERMSLAECEAEVDRLTRYVESLHAAGVKTVIPYICDVLVFGDHVERTGFWEFYDHWDEYESLGLGKKPESDPATWMQGGERRPVEGSGWFVYGPCINHPDWQRYLRAIVRIIAQCGYDGAFVDVNSFRCRNECCRSPFARYLQERYDQAALEDLFGFDSADSVRVPDRDEGGLLWVETCRFRAESFARLFTMLREEGERIRPNFLVLPNLSPMAHIDGVRTRIGNGQDTGRWAEACDWLMFEEMQQSGLFGADTVSDCILQYKLALASGIRGGMLLYHAVDADGVALAMAETGAGGGGALIQPGYGSPEVRTRYASFWRENRDMFEGLQPWSQIGVCYFRDESYWGNIDHMRAVYRIRRHLSDEHVLFDFIVEQSFRAETLRRYRAVVLPEVRHLSEEQVQALCEYVTGGGVLLIQGACGEFDELGRQRLDIPFVTPETAQRNEGVAAWAMDKGWCARAEDLDAVAPSRRFELFDLTEDDASEIDIVLERARNTARETRVPSPFLKTLQSITQTDFSVAENDVPQTVRISAFIRESEETLLAVHLLNYNVPIRGKAESGPVAVVRDTALRLPLPVDCRAVSVDILEPGSEPQSLSFTQREDRLHVSLPELSTYKVLRIRGTRRVSKGNNAT